MYTAEQQKLADELAANGWRPTVIGKEWMSGSGLYRICFHNDGTTALETPTWGSAGEVSAPDDLGRGMRAVGALKCS